MSLFQSMASQPLERTPEAQPGLGHDELEFERFLEQWASEVRILLTRTCISRAIFSDAGFFHVTFKVHII